MNLPSNWNSYAYIIEKVLVDSLESDRTLTFQKLERMAADLRDENVLSKFDKLARMNIIRHSPSKVVSIVDQAFPVRFFSRHTFSVVLGLTDHRWSFASAQAGLRSQ